MKKMFLMALLLAGVQAMAQTESEKATQGEEKPELLAKYVDPMIGTGDHSHVFVGANVPFGIVNADPTQYERGWD
ncbi:MAG: hypothetical protein II505_06810, partial [Bacteroidaceae bacterium]|nr:hypothetical protein [Bacteroidaceae bacterium]